MAINARIAFLDILLCRLGFFVSIVEYCSPCNRLRDLFILSGSLPPFKPAYFTLVSFSVADYSRFVVLTARMFIFKDMTIYRIAFTGRLIMYFRIKKVLDYKDVSKQYDM